MERTPFRALKLSVSSESMDVPAGQPTTDSFVVRSWTPLTGIGSGETPRTMSLPLGARPPITEAMAELLFAVAKMALAPPRAWRACAGSSVALSM